jgi:hypothetical protein
MVFRLPFTDGVDAWNGLLSGVRFARFVNELTKLVTNPLLSPEVVISPLLLVTLLGIVCKFSASNDVVDLWDDFFTCFSVSIWKITANETVEIEI